MKNIYPGLIFMLVFLPQVSFGQTQVAGSVSVYQQQAADRSVFIHAHQDLIARQDREAKAFYQQQADDRAAFMKANPGIIAKQDRYGKRLMSDRNASIRPEEQLTPEEQSALTAFGQKQASDNQAFVQKLARERQNSSAGAGANFSRTNLSSTTTSGTTTSGTTTSGTTTPSTATSSTTTSGT